MISEIEIGARRVGYGHPVFIIAEAGVNHNGDIETALKLVDLAKNAGADAVKFQTYTADRLATPEAPKAAYQLQHTDRRESQLAMLRRLELSPQAHKRLADHCRQQGILFLSTPFDEQSADFLSELNVPAYKLPSGEITNLPFLRHVARKAKPIILSTGMSYLAEVETAVRAIEQEGNNRIVLLHCVSDYPADPKDANLRAMDTMAAAFQVPIGYSDHTPGIEVSLAAVARGACIIEKHFTIDKTWPGPDQKASLSPAELMALVKGIRIVETSLGHNRKEPTLREMDTARAARKSLIAAQDIPAGTTLSEDMIHIRRPGTGLLPIQLPLVLGKKVKRALRVNELIAMEDLL